MASAQGRAQPIQFFLIGAALIGLTYGLGYRVAQSDFWWIIGLYAPFFLLYLYANRLASSAPSGWAFFLGLGVLLRVILLFSLPALSDDVYRFVWDGRLLAQGYNPFEQLPSYYLAPGREVPGITRELFEQLNSPEYFTIYPPVAQATFALAAWLSPQSLPGSVLVMKLFLLACELGALRLLILLLRHFGKPIRHVLLYALNPLIIIEIMGNLHYEGAMIFFLLLAFWWLIKGRLSLSAIAMGLSITSKLLPLLFLPFLIRRLGWRRSLGYFAGVAAVVIGLFLPMADPAFLGNFAESLDLYFRKFEFNASVYYLERWVGYQKVGYNMIAQIGPVLAAITALTIFLAALLDRRRSWEVLPEQFLFAITLYLALTTTVHPWYVSLPVVLCIFTRFRFPILWSGLIFLTYVNYSYDPYWENLWVVAAEYLAVLGFLIWELSGEAPAEPSSSKDEKITNLGRSE